MIGYDGQRWCCHFWFVGWHCISLGLHVDISSTPHIEIHIPFGFIRIGCQPNKVLWFGPGWHFHANPNWKKVK
jgi:hypothetical protein